MIAHLVLFQPRPDLTPTERDAVVAALSAAARATPGVRTCRIGRRVTHGLAGYEQAMRQDYEFAAMIEFDTLESLRAYLQHPSHDAVGEHFSTAAVAALAYDYEMVSLDDAARLANS